MTRRALSLLALLCLAASVVPADAGAQTFDVLAYHDVRDDVSGDFDADQYAVSTRHLIDHFTWLKENGFHPVSIDDLLAAQSGTRALPDKAVLITFDDGLRSVYTHVLPLLKLFGYPAVVSVVTDWIEHDAGVAQAGRTLTRADFMTWDQIAELSRSGLVEIASHSHDLHRGIRGNPQGNEQPAAVTLRVDDDGRYESPAAYRARVGADLATSAGLIERHTGRRPRVMTWPYGARNGELERLAANLGMAIGLTLDDGTSDVRRLGALPRHLMQANPGVEELGYALLQPPSPPLIRAAQVDLDYVYDPDPEQQERNLGRLLDRIKALDITHVFLQAFADPDGDGGADALYFPNRALPMRADLFNRVAWQLKTRANVLVYAWLPLLSFTGPGIDSTWYVQQYADGAVTRAGDAEPRLSPFEPRARALIMGIYADLAAHASFDGVLFHDDGRLGELEDASPAAMAAYREAFGAGFTLAALRGDAALRQHWASLRTTAMLDLSAELAAAVRAYRPTIKTARNLFAPAVLDATHADEQLAQDYAAFLHDYDYVALMAMPYLEEAADPRRFYEQLAATTRRLDPGAYRTIFELQTVDWRSGAPIPAPELKDTMRMLQALGIRNLAYYPDDYVRGRPDLDQLRQGLSVARFPRGQKP
jgi:biofilm PGA synthesis lipoprotein PgaB